MTTQEPLALVSVDAEVCEGQAVCTRFSPSTFVLDDDAETVRIQQQPADEETLRVVRLAVKRCPKQALSLWSDGRRRPHD